VLLRFMQRAVVPRRAGRRLRILLLIGLLVRFMQRTVVPRLAQRLLSRDRKTCRKHYDRFDAGAAIAISAARRISARAIHVAHPSLLALALFAPPHLGNDFAGLAQIRVLAAIMRRGVCGAGLGLAASRRRVLDP